MDSELSETDIAYVFESFWVYASHVDGASSPDILKWHITHGQSTDDMSHPAICGQLESSATQTAKCTGLWEVIRKCK